MPAELSLLAGPRAAAAGKKISSNLVNLPTEPCARSSDLVHLPTEPCARSSDLVNLPTEPCARSSDLVNQ